MKTCSSCKQLIPEDKDICLLCGAAVGPGITDRVNMLLREANTQRIRGNHQAAIDICTDALALQPSNPDVHSLLGDIYDAKGNSKDAAYWYQSAVDLRPGFAPDEAKLRRASHKLERINGRENKFKTDLWIHPENKIDNVLRYIVIICVVSVLVLLMIGLIGWVGRGRNQEKADAHNRVVATGQNGAKLPGDASALTHGLKSDTTATLVRPVSEQQILSNLATNPTIMRERLVVQDVKSDPRSNTFTVTYGMPDSPTALTKLVIRKYSAIIAAAAFAADSDASTVTIRTLVNMPGRYAAGEPHLVFVGDMQRHETGVDVNTANSSTIDGLFANEWWGSEVSR